LHFVTPHHMSLSVICQQQLLTHSSPSCTERKLAIANAVRSKHDATTICQHPHPQTLMFFSIWPDSPVQIVSNEMASMHAPIVAACLNQKKPQMFQHHLQTTDSFLSEAALTFDCKVKVWLCKSPKRTRHRDCIATTLSEGIKLIRRCKKLPHSRR
jgi:hypothetical protein